MPFTFAHPAIILPLSKNKKLPLSALIIGSLIPDFEFYFQLREVEQIGHDTIGIILFDIPAGFLMLFIYHHYIRIYLRTILPDVVLYKCNTLVYNFKSNQKNLFSLNNLLALLIGITSHLFLDLFTHHYSFLITYVPQLKETIGFFNYSMPLFQVNQILLSIVGLFIVFFFYLKIPSTASTNHEFNLNNILSFLFLATLILAVRLIFFSSYNSFWSIVVAVVGACLYSLIINSMLYYFKKNKSKRNNVAAQ
ncbi:MAG: DUF4184 family protein [Chitinophagaceae bacterium]